MLDFGIDLIKIRSSRRIFLDIKKGFRYFYHVYTSITLYKTPTGTKQLRKRVTEAGRPNEDKEVPI